MDLEKYKYKRALEARVKNYPACTIIAKAKLD